MSIKETEAMMVDIINRSREHQPPLEKEGLRYWIANAFYDKIREKSKRLNNHRRFKDFHQKCGTW